MEYFTSKTVDLPFDQAIEKVTDLLKEEGFGVLTEIDVKDTLKKKLDVDFKKYKTWEPAIQILLTRHCRQKTRLA
jgi:uncharacterized protein (DUF302 family)|nr:DUF302 domain-containing protein [Aliifodinibius salipaludis]